MILFFVSLILIFLSAYVLTSILCKPKDIEGFLYIPLIMFAQIIFNFEFLSLFKLIDKIPFLIINILWLIISFFIFYKRKKQYWAPEFKHFFRRLLNCLKLDKSLIILGIAYLFFIYVSIYLNVITPITNADAMDYHVARSVFWLVNKSLNHYFVPDIRQLCFPINSELLYSWVILFTQKIVFLGMFSFIGYLMAVFSIFNIMSDYCYRKRLWVILILSSFPSIIVQVSGTETDVLLAGLILTSVYLFKTSLNKNSKINLYISSLAYALAIGTKTPSLFVIPAIGILFLIMEYRKTKNLKFRNFLTFISFGILNFILFASYNYILNFINYGNIMGSSSLLLAHKNSYGIKGAIANFIKHIVLLFDFTAFKWGKGAAEIILPLRDLILTKLQLNTIPDGVFAGDSNIINMSLMEPCIGEGVIGIVTFIPCLCLSLIGLLFNRKMKSFNLFLQAFLFFTSLFILSYVICFMTYNVRFITFMIMIFAPVVVYSYSHNRVYKFLVIFFAVFYLTVFSTHIWARPYTQISKCMFKNHETISVIRRRIITGNYKTAPAKLTDIYLFVCDKTKSLGKQTKILAIFTTPHDYLSYAMLNLKGYHVDFKSPETLTMEEMKKYDYLLIKTGIYQATNIINYENNKNKYIINREDEKLEYIADFETFACFYVDKDLYYTQTEKPYKCLCRINENFINDNFDTNYSVYWGFPGKDAKRELKYVLYKNKK